MKKFSFLIVLLTSAVISFAQHVPQGMKYQAVARNLSGNVMANQAITLKINLLTQGTTSTIFYSETHSVTTNQVGLFTLTIGEGKIEKGTFAGIPWSTQDIWMQVALKDKGQPDFTTISNSKLLAVPYAFHAGTAESIVGGKQTAIASSSNQNLKTEAASCSCQEGLSAVSVLYLGNSNVDIKVYGDDDCRKLMYTFPQVKNGDILNVKAGPLDHNKLPDELYFKIMNTTIPVLEMQTGCNDAIVGETFGNYSVISRTDAKNNVTCAVCDIKQDWKVGGNLVMAACNLLGAKNKSDLVVVTDNTERMRVTADGNIEIKRSLKVGANLNVDSNFTVNKQSPSLLTGSLTVNGVTNLNNALGVVGATTLQNTLGVTGATTLNNTLGVVGATTLQNTLRVTGGANLQSTLGVTGATTLQNTLSVNNLTTITDATQSNGSSNGALVVSGGVGIAKNLNVGGSVNFGGTSAFGGQLHITDITQSNAVTTGALIVDGGTGIAKNLNVGGIENLAGDLNVNTDKFNVAASTGNTSVAGTLGVTGNVNINTNKFNVIASNGNTSVAGTLAITGATALNNTLTTNGAATFNSSLNVAGKSHFLDSATFDKSLQIDANIKSKTLTVTSNDTGYIATFNNTNNGHGDGLKIKLGKTHPMWQNGSYVHVLNYSAEQFQTQIDVLKGWIIDKKAFEFKDLAALMPSSLLTGTVINIVNLVTAKIDSALSLPIYVGPYSIPQITMPEVVMPAISIPKLEVPKVTIHTPDPLPNFDIPGFTITEAREIIGRTTLIPRTQLIPETELIPRFPIVPSIPQIPNPFPSIDLTVPNIAGTDVANSLTHENEFLTFVDKDDRVLGAIRAQSINDFGANYFDGVYFVNVMASVVGIDLVGGFMGAIAEFTNLIDDYNNIGVEYSSGHGDYAEWLPRVNTSELISSGDIVGIKGGKITKDLKGAEQVMAVSYRPIMLGNAPTKEEDQSGNKVAFLGQIPVKVMGKVNMGDFIVGKSDMPGYGIAVNPAKITAEDLKLSVGRAWENSTNEGPKMINTLIGIQNGDYLNILKKSQDKVESMEKRLAALEEKIMNSNNKNSK